MHGGTSLSGAASPTFKTGRYSKSLPAQLAARYHEALTDRDLLALRDEIGLVDAHVGELLESFQDDPDDPDTWERIIAGIEQRRKLVESERKRLVEMRQMITAEQALALIAAISDVVRRHVDDPHILGAISRDIARIIGRPGRDDDRGEPGDSD